MTDKLSPTRIAGAEYSRHDWVVTVEQGTTKKEILNPMFWSHISPQLSPYDRIELRIDDGIFFAELLVTACERTWAKVHVLHWHNMTTADVAESQADEVIPAPGKGYEVAWKGPHKKFCVIRKADQEIVHEGDSKEGANAWLKDYITVVA
ncbi:MAG: hypothetical protein ACYC36_03520 [Bellilinea sp.]